ncbi:YcdB/YcdC domain-containing protein [Aneurinibacillus aneurinilyticus]|uniref:YcdB/YcdC domain-containing protein n=2 Tax=Aneurinibacillus aneurinilyticus TaxID=1391 RepID=UPI00352624FB
MKRTLPLTALFLSSSLMLTPSVLAEEVESGATQATSTQAAKATETTEALTPIPAAVQKTMDRLFTLQPELKKLNIITSGGREDSQRFLVGLSDRPEEKIKKEDMSAYLEFDRNTGDLLSFDIRATAWASEKLPSRQLAQDTAERFLTEWFGTEGRKQFGKPTRYSDFGSATRNEDGSIVSWRTCSVEFPLLLNGIPIENKGVRLEVDSLGHITTYSYDPVDVDTTKIPKPDTALPIEEVIKNMTTADSISLNYVQEQSGKDGQASEETKTKPVLRYDLDSRYIHAQTGKKALDTGLKPTGTKTVLYPKGQTLIARSEEEVKQLLAKLFDINSATGTVRVYQPIDLPWQKERRYLDYQFNTEDGQVTAHVTTDKKTGHVYSVSLSTNKEQKKQAARITEEQAFTVARDFLETYADSSATELELQQKIFEEPEIPSWVDKSKLPEMTDDPNGTYSFYFTKLHQGIPVQDHSYHVSIDKQTGKVVSFHLFTPSKKVELPDSQNIVTKEEALATLIKHRPPLELKYTWSWYMGQQAPAPLLVYTWDNSDGFGYVDALTGEYIKEPIDQEDE